MNLDSKLDIEIAKGSETVAFNYYSVTAQTLDSTTPVVFDKSRLNTCGDCFNSKTGYFTAPVHGIFQFNAQLCTNKEGNLEYQIRAGGKTILAGEYRAPADSDDEKCTSFSTVYAVNKEETVSVHGYNTPLDCQSEDELSFSGALIKVL